MATTHHASEPCLAKHPYPGYWKWSRGMQVCAYYKCCSTFEMLLPVCCTPVDDDIKSCCKYGCTPSILLYMLLQVLCCAQCRSVANCKCCWKGCCRCAVHCSTVAHSVTQGAVHVNVAVHVMPMLLHSVIVAAHLKCYCKCRCTL